MVQTLWVVSSSDIGRGGVVTPVIVTCVRWYLRFCLSFRDLEELMAERGLAVDHTTIFRWTQTYGPEVYRRLRGEVKRKSSTWHMDETFVRIAGGPSD